MKRASINDKRLRKRQLLVARTADALGASHAQAADLLRIERRQSVRINPLAANPENTVQAMQSLGWHGDIYKWLDNAYTADVGLEALRDSQAEANGTVYIQNAASWLPALALDPLPYETVLDVCAAPGGKTTHIAALANNLATITANDNSRSRLIRLRSNCRRMRADIHRFTLHDARFLARQYDGEQFDKILVDAPCSGEGMLRLDDNKHIDMWSIAHIKRLQSLQKRIINQSWQLLKPGGTLVYSTCTIAPEENEAVINYALRTLPDLQIIKTESDLPNRVPAVTSWREKDFNSSVSECLRLQPSTNIEAFFVCKLRKGTSSN